MIHRFILGFISGFCDKVKESSWIENGRKRFLRQITDGDTSMDEFGEELDAEVD